VRPLALPPVAPALTAPARAPDCTLAKRDAYPPEVLEAERRCLREAARVARSHHGALAAAVRVREQAASRMITER
jgi:hypothetical protein